MKQLLVMLLFLCSASVSAQDVIVKKDGSMVNCRVVELTESEIVYKKWSDLNGSNYVMERSAASAINYQNGKKVNLSEATNLYKPNNQNDGVQQYNDRALLGMDYANQKIDKKIKKLRTWGWICGIAGVCIGAAISSKFHDDGYGEFTDDGVIFYVGGPIVAGGIAATCCFISAHKKQKQAEMYLQSSSLYHYNFKFGNGSTLSAGINMLSDRTTNINTFGIGLHYNF